MKAKSGCLSARMKAVAQMISPGNKVCDVGCDHGYISIYLIQEKIAPQVLAMDINQGPMSRAEGNVCAAKLENYITLRLSDGLAQYQIGEAKTLLCAGMGGALIRKIMTDQPNKTADFEEFILQPQSEIRPFRRFLRETGYAIIAEDMVYEDEKFYPIIKAVHGSGESHQPELEDRYGPLLLRSRHPVLQKFLEKEWQSTLELMELLERADMTPKTVARQAELSEELLYLCKAGQICGMGGNE